jgi:hypothetical protein
MTPAERGDLAERLLPTAAQLACVVHGEGDARDVDYHTRQLDRTELIALIVLLSAMVDPDRRVAAALDFVRWDEEGRPAPAQALGRRTLRGLASAVEGPQTLGAARVLESERIQLARELHLGQGYTITEVATKLGASATTVKKWAAEGGWAA